MFLSFPGLMFRISSLMSLRIPITSGCGNPLIRRHQPSGFLITTYGGLVTNGYAPATGESFEGLCKEWLWWHSEAETCLSPSCRWSFRVPHPERPLRETLRAVDSKQSTLNFYTGNKEHQTSNSTGVLKLSSGCPILQQHFSDTFL